MYVSFFKFWEGPSLFLPEAHTRHRPPILTWCQHAGLLPVPKTRGSSPLLLMWFKPAEINTGGAGWGEGEEGSWMGGPEWHKHPDWSQTRFVPCHGMTWPHGANPVDIDGLTTTLLMETGPQALPPMTKSSTCERADSPVYRSVPAARPHSCLFFLWLSKIISAAFIFAQTSFSGSPVLVLPSRQTRKSLLIGTVFFFPPSLAYLLLSWRHYQVLKRYWLPTIIPKQNTSPLADGTCSVCLTFPGTNCTSTADGFNDSTRQSLHLANPNGSRQLKVFASESPGKHLIKEVCFCKVNNHT